MSLQDTLLSEGRKDMVPLEQSKLEGRMLLLTDQLGAVAREIKHILVRSTPTGEADLEEKFSDLLAQVWSLHSDLDHAGLVSSSMDELLVRGLNRMERLKLEAKVRGHGWIG